MVDLSVMFLNSLGITPEGNCTKHPQVNLICDESRALLKECALCWKEQGDRKARQDNNEDEVTMNTEKLATVPPTLPTIHSGSTLTSSLGGISTNDTAWIGAVQLRWAQVQENGVCAMLENGHAVNKENGCRRAVEGIEEISRSRTNVQLKKLEEQVMCQDATIQRLRETIQQQETNIRQDIQQLMLAVSALSSVPTAAPTRAPKEAENPGLSHDLETTPPTKSGKTTGVQRPTMYSKVQHPANMFTSVRTIERRPPKPPTRHCSFSTNTVSSQKSMQSSAFSSLGTSTELASQQDIEVDFCRDYEPGLESMLERERSKKLEIIFDASGKISSEGLDEGNSGGRPSPRFEKSKGDKASQEREHSGSPVGGQPPSFQMTKASDWDGSPSEFVPGSSRRVAFSPTTSPQVPQRAPSEPDLGSRDTLSFSALTGPSTASGTSVSATIGHVPQPKMQLTRQISRRNPASNLLKLSHGNAPPRREIFASKMPSKMHISCLTIDSAIDLSEHSEIDDGSVYREVTDFLVADKLGERGYYTGTLREEDSHEGEDGKILLPHGKGTMYYEAGDTFYEGEWRDGHWHGRGFLRNSNGDTYEGDFVLDARHGRGIYKYANGDAYNGDFSGDMRHGQGTFIFSSGGAVYRGGFQNGNFEGSGCYEFEDGHYEGEWQAGLYHGIGTLHYKNNSNYTGRFTNGKADGLGEKKAANCTIRTGAWIQGEVKEEAHS